MSVRRLVCKDEEDDSQFERNEKMTNALDGQLLLTNGCTLIAKLWHKNVLKMDSFKSTDEKDSLTCGRVWTKRASHR